MIQDRSELLAAFYERHFGRASENSHAHSNGNRSELSDEEVVRLCRGARNAPKFEALYDRGDLGEYAGDSSRADQALMSILAFYTQDPGQLDRLFRDSALYRSEKWGRRPDYRRRTIQKALSNLTETYAPSDDGARMVVGNGHATLQSPSLYEQGDFRNGLISDEEHHNDHRAAYPSMLIADKLKALRSPSLYRPSTAARMASSQTGGVRKPRRPKGSAVQDELPSRR